jgi:DNA-3-methyladenine glycosylase II
VPTVTLALNPIPPFRLDLTVWVLNRSPEYVVDGWDGETYRRTLTVKGKPVAMSVRQLEAPEQPVLEVELQSGSDLETRADEARCILERLLGTNVDLSGFYRLADADERLGPLVNRFRGFKPTRYPSIFECLTNAITCQLVSLNVGLLVLSRLVEAYGTRIDGCLSHPPAFPTPAAIAGADPDHLRQMGFSRQKARALIELAGGLASDSIDLSDLNQADDEEAIRRLVALRGIGRWTAEYTLLRGLGRLHLFPGDDVGARNTLRRWTESDLPLDYDGVRTTLARWQPYAGLLYFQMLLLGLESKARVRVD